MRLRRVIEEVHPPNNPHDATGPRHRLTARQWRRPLAGQDARQLPTQCAVFGIEMLLAEGVGEFHDLVVRRAYGLANRRIAGGCLGTIRPLLGLEFRPGWSRHLRGWRERRDD